MPVTWCGVYGELVVLVVSLGNSSYFFQVIISQVSSPGTSQQTQTQLVAFDEGERFLMQSKSTFLEFLRGIHRYKFGLPEKFFRGEIIQGE